MLPRTSSIWQRDSHPTASGKPGAVQNRDMGRRADRRARLPALTRMSWAIVDVANFYVSAERLFDPGLHGVPVIVLSNNDGCAVARSEEAKALHVRMGEPVFKMRDRIKRHGIQLRSSNYELYADLNRRFNAVIAEHSDMVEIYSIDESFFRLPVLPSGLGDVRTAHQVREDIARCVGLPTRIGLGPDPIEGGERARQGNREGLGRRGRPSRR